ncbi:MAG: universal stress protein [Candidatus Bathyarchaeia archaeon]|jgi:nucleotide-binding universal stress UspA family protein
MISKILVPLDGSEPASRALDFSCYLADKCSAEILVLGVIEPMIAPVFSRAYGQPMTQPMETPPIPPVSPAEVRSIMNSQKVHYENLLFDALEKARKNYPNLKISTQLKEGQPSDEIIETAKEGCFDIIVIGSRGLGGIKGFFLGSVSKKVTNEAVCPVLIVK